MNSQKYWAKVWGEPGEDNGAGAALATETPRKSLPLKGNASATENCTGRPEPALTPSASWLADHLAQAGDAGCASLPFDAIFAAGAAAGFDEREIGGAYDALGLITIWVAGWPHWTLDGSAFDVPAAVATIRGYLIGGSAPQAEVAGLKIDDHPIGPDLIRAATRRLRLEPVEVAGVTHWKLPY